MTAARMPTRPLLIPLAAAAILTAACAWPFSETDANGWRYESRTVGDWRTEFTSSKGEIGGPGRLVLHCGIASFEINRDRLRDESDPVPSAYRFDDGPWIGTPAIYTGFGAGLRDAAEEDPVYRRLAGTGRLAIVLSPPGEAPIAMEFDLTGIGEALRRVREHRTCRPG